MWYAKIATEEKQKGFSFDYWKNWLDKEKIVCDGQHIPEYLWTKEQYKKYNVKEDICKTRSLVICFCLY